MTGTEIWKEYYARTADRPPRPTLLCALEAFDSGPRSEKARMAIDLGCGIGRDTLELLRRGWRVLAIDGQAAAIDGLLARAELAAEMRVRLETAVAPFEDVALPSCHLVNASFSLQGCPRDDFYDVWARMQASLLPGGRFSGQLLGSNDSWAAPDSGKPGLSYFGRPEVKRLLAAFEIEWLEEVEEDSVTPRGEAKHWHFFHIVARRP